MKHLAALSLVAVLAACGGGEPADNAASQPEAAAPAPAAAAAAQGEMTMPDWFHVDDANRTVHMTITAGLTPDKNHWNFNGAYDGNMTITVPEGYTVTVDLVNNDPFMAHSMGISAVTSNFGIVDATPVFEGAISSNPTSMTESTMPGQTESVTFTASAAGNYSMVCFVPGHAAAGMWIHFNVSADGSKGVQSAL